MRSKWAIGRFLRDTRGGATSIAAVGVTIMTLGGGALIIDHNQLVGQRDILQSASDAASLAATLELNRLPDTMSAEDARARVESVARKYAVLNVLANAAEPDIAERDVSVSFSIDPGTKIVNATVGADIAKTLVAGWLHGVSGPSTVQTVSGVESIERTVEVVLAIDISGSMKQDLGGTDVGWEDERSRMAIVKAAAKAMVDILAPESGEGVAFGIVPWDVRVRLSRAMRANWAGAGWAVYPQKRRYEAPYECRKNGRCRVAPPQTDDLPATAPGRWRGCLSEHRVTDGLADITAASEWLVPPSEKAFAQGFYPPVFGRAYRCLTDSTMPDLFHYQRCYGSKVDPITHMTDEFAPQACRPTRRPILPLTTDRDAVADRIDALEPAGGATYSALGLLWAQRMLTPEWRDVWGDAVHPVDSGDSVRKAIVLLTDGQDNRCGPKDPNCEFNRPGYLRAPVCEAIKAAGTEIFVVAAMHPEKVTGQLGPQLIACSSEGEGGGTYAFLNNETPDALRAAFADIARQLRGVRRIY